MVLEDATGKTLAWAHWKDVRSNYDDIDKVNAQAVKDYIDYLNVANAGDVANWKKRSAIYDKIDAQRDWYPSSDYITRQTNLIRTKLIEDRMVDIDDMAILGTITEYGTYDADIREYGVSIGPWEPEGFIEENLAPYEIEAKKSKRDPKVVQRELVDLRRSIRHMTRDPEPVGTTHEGVMNPEALKMTHYWGAMFTGGWNG